MGDVEYTTITDSVYAGVPGKLRVLDGRLFWHDVRAAEGFMHVVDARTGNEVCRFGNIGDIPDDFVLLMLSVSSDGIKS